MGKIVYKNYVITLSDGCEDRFDLKVKTGTFRKRKEEDEEKEVLKVIGYGLNFSNCINKIVHLEVFSNDEEYELKEIIKIYESKYNEIKDLLTA